MTVDLLEDELVLTGRLLSASNATFAARIGDVEVVYKPVAGERPLWDFPDGDLASREIAAYRVSQVLGGEVVPPTWWRDGPLGAGMVQRWQHTDPGDAAVTLVGAGEVPDGWCRVLDGLDATDRPVSLVHEDSAALRRMAVLDIVLNNADRKGGHVLALGHGVRRGVDHGLTFHVEPKLRTVLWGWIGVPLSPDELDAVARVRAALDGDLGAALGDLLTVAELDALAARCDRLVAAGRFPAPSPSGPAVPWPPF